MYKKHKSLCILFDKIFNKVLSMDKILIAIELFYYRDVPTYGLYTIVYEYTEESQYLSHLGTVWRRTIAGGSAGDQRHILPTVIPFSLNIILWLKATYQSSYII